MTRSDINSNVKLHSCVITDRSGFTEHVSVENSRTHLIIGRNRGGLTSERETAFVSEDLRDTRGQMERGRSLRGRCDSRKREKHREVLLDSRAATSG